MRPGATRVVSTLPLAVVLLALGSTLLTPVAAQEAQELEWGAALQLSESTELSDDPTVALGPDGAMLIAWRERLAARYSVFFATLDADGNLVGERRELGDNLSASMDPAVAVDSQGRYHFVWTALEDQELYYARTDRLGTLSLGPLRLTEASGDSAESSIWMDSRDHLHVVWFDGRDRVTWLYYMQLDSDGSKVVEDTPLVRALTEQESAVTMDTAGDLHVVWNGIAPPTNLQWRTELHYTKLSSTGQVLVEDRLVATSRGQIGFPDVSSDLSDHLHLVWPEGTSRLQRVMYAELDSSGRTVVDPLEVSGDLARPARDVTIAVDGNDRLHLVWSEGTQGNSELAYAALAPGGEPLGDPVAVTSAIGDSKEPTVALSPRGEPRVVWSDFRTGNAEVYLKVASRPTPGVDLALYAADIAFEPPTATADEALEVSLVVHNHGDERSPATTARLDMDGSTVATGQVPSIEAGGSRERTFTVYPTEGRHVLAAIVDPEGVVEESDELNNEAVRAFTAYPEGQLIADAGPDQTATEGEVVYMDATGTVYRGDGVLSYQWDFGDGSPLGNGLYVGHVYEEEGTYGVELTVSDGQVEDSDVCSVVVERYNEPPRAVIEPGGLITADRLHGVTLSAAASTDDVGIESYRWDLGDGTVSSGAQVSHQYTETGLYVVELTVTDVGGLIDVNKTTVEVANLLPVVTGPEVDPGARAGEDVTFSVNASDPDGSVSMVGWDFDARDGILVEAEGQRITWRFESEGTYNVTCIVRDDDGGQRTVHLEYEVLPRDEGPVPAPWGLMALLAMAAAGLVGRGLAQRPY